MACVVSWNCRGFRTKVCHIKGLIFEVNPVCIALQETCLKPVDIAKIKRYSLLRKDNENESGRVSGGVALMVSHDTPSSVITLRTNLQAVAVRVTLSILVTVCTLYFPPSTNVNDGSRQINASIPKSGLGFPKNRKPWWNKHCTDTNRNQIKTWNVFRRHPASANQIAFQRAKGIARWARRESEREYWIKFVSNINSTVKTKDMWDNVGRACGIYPEKRVSCLRKNGQEVRNISEMDVLAEAFASIFSASNYTEPFLTHKNRTERIKLRFQTTKHLTILT
ncbi:hypothetical protein AVEN_208851-1 [Araneus ventricosus]|uniref:Endonuclease/exonuclease/phosphatase domain-containing protein n=1 Tax=Araneus ventricosus TaxID=182803 RepID=A0A4Y2KNQ6_ARAVE|nr:hypothetical protein AVEN_208851-1 [Araneus ventricosus]